MKVSEAFVAFILILRSSAIHHMKRKLLPRQDTSSSTPLIITNNCKATIYPGIITQSGTGPPSSGFALSPGSNKAQTVSENWQGRVWGRTNCSFNAQGTSNGGGTACQTGDCNSAVSCSVTGNTPVTLAEFTLDAGDGQTYYDISLVDGYNLPMAVVLVPHGNTSLDNIPPNLTNPSCLGSIGVLAASSFDPYTNTQQSYLGTNSSFPLPFETKVTSSQVADWCPWDLQVSPPSTPDNGVYPYPDSNIQRPVFDPCYSACAKYNQDKYCCTGSYDSPSVCKTNYYSKAAKLVCPDAYSFAYDDQTSTFIIPSGAGFQVVFCPEGRSTNILATKAAQLKQLASQGSVSGSGGSSSATAAATSAANATPIPDARDWLVAMVLLLVCVAVWAL